MHNIEIQGSRLAYLDVGQGPVLLFGHSYLWDSAMWAPQVEVLSQHYRCIVPDLWDHGQSGPRPAGCRNLAGVADTMLALMDALQIEEFTVVGLSVGGMWGTELALKAPARVQALVLMNTFVGLEPEVTHQKYFGMLRMIEQTGGVPAPMAEQIVPLFFANDVKQANPGLADGFKAVLLGLAPERVEGVVAMGRMIFGRRDLIDQLPKLTLPVLILTGQQDKARSVLESYLMQDEITASVLKEIPHAGHISTLENPGFVNDALGAFLQQAIRRG
ncbi:Pimeloyl-ACP methyl ester carboxylesterase [Ferrimonas sediminum]|uniref:Pimeloyl-ACP methyl ester carboxylesterase n=1 Tax=Ferrimonas sediminum TaxID=718193 RepID=A0A1G8RWZ6_9GAMM|nr:alpha/beta hydrolase [Ferrimonas sediminum]SDJ21436.1 Pimeloyl-ACP methyl ester carboxylesterase [Ferrimonas sediminum]